jgi:hypothetical protein
MENNVREKVIAAIKNSFDTMSVSYDHRIEMLTDAVLQSPDLKVTIREQRFRVDGTVVREHLPLSHYCIASFTSNERARQYADWLNSKEPKIAS